MIAHDVMCSVYHCNGHCNKIVAVSTEQGYMDTLPALHASSLVAIAKHKHELSVMYENRGRTALLATVG